MVELREALMRWLASRSQREQRVLVAGLVLATVAALYALVWEPALAATRRLSTQLPRMRAQVEEMSAHQLQVVALRKAINESRREGTPQAVAQALLASDPAYKAARSQWQSSERLSVDIPAIDFDRWLALAGRLQSEGGLRVESCTISALPQRGVVRVEAVLAAPPAHSR